MGIGISALLWCPPLMPALQHSVALHLLSSSRYAGEVNDDDDDDDADYEEDQRQQRTKQLLLAAYVEVLRRREERIQRRNTHRTYLTRPDLNPSPRIGTPWQHMHARGNDHAFITTMRVDVATLEHLLNQGFTEMWDSKLVSALLRKFLIRLSCLSTRSSIVAFIV